MTARQRLITNIQQSLAEDCLQRIGSAMTHEQMITAIEVAMTQYLKHSLVLISKEAGA